MPKKKGEAGQAKSKGRARKVGGKTGAQVKSEAKQAKKAEAHAAREAKEAGEVRDRDRLEEEMGSISVKDALYQTMVTFTSLGYQRLGLPEETNKKYRDFDQARLAIDCLQALIDAGGKSLPAAELDPFKNSLAHLQIQFVAQQKSG